MITGFWLKKQLFTVGLFADLVPEHWIGWSWIDYRPGRTHIRIHFLWFTLMIRHAKNA